MYVETLCDFKNSYYNIKNASHGLLKIVQLANIKIQSA